jgi:hypothetical protein
MSDQANAKFWRNVAAQILNEDRPARPVIVAAFGVASPSATRAENLAKRTGVKLHVAPLKLRGSIAHTRLWNATVRAKGRGFVLGAECSVRVAYAALAFAYAERGKAPPAIEGRIAA